MGQAKQRGTYEQRRAEGIARREREEQDRLERIRKREEERRQREAKRRAALSDEEREAEDARKQKVAVVTVAAMGLANSYRDQINEWSGKDIF